MKSYSSRWRTLILVFTLFLSLPLTASDSEKMDLNHYYKYPLSAGFEYGSLSTFSDYEAGAPYSIYELSGNIRFPLPPAPIIQLMAKGGMLEFNSNDSNNLIKWDSTHYFGMIGAGLSHRFSKMYEMGGHLLGGYSQSIFTNLIEGQDAVAAHNLLFEGSLEIGFNPSYSFSLCANPGVKYIHSLSPLDNFNGPVFNFGISGNFRFGKDPDSPDVEIRSIRFGTPDFPDLFAAMQSYYAKNPLGYVEITNTERSGIEEIQVAFFQPGFMDVPTPSFTCAELAGGESVKVPLQALFNNEVFITEGITPLTGEIIVTYRVNRRTVEQRLSVSYDLYDKKMMTWDDDRKIAAFITPADSALQNYGSFIRQSCKDAEIPGLSKGLQTGMQVFHALGEIGCLYQLDPMSPFTAAQENSMVPDSVSLPRDTLKKITGDCDDLTVLYCSLMETVGMESAFITIPGHIFAAFNTGVESRDFAKIHTDRNMTLPIDGELWIPVEITLIGKATFREAWRKGMENWNRYRESPEVRQFIRTRSAQEVYRPVGLREKDMGLQYGEPERILRGFIQDRDSIVTDLTHEQYAAAEASGSKQDYNKLGILYAQMGQYTMAEKTFIKALSLDNNYRSAGVNLGNIYFHQKKYEEALEQYLDVEQILKQANRSDSSTAMKVYLNISRAYYGMEELDKAQEYFQLASVIDESEVSQFAYIMTPVDRGGTRAAEIREADVIYMEEEAGEYQ
ncbi:MAG: tetratricopeptide repeat protein [Spirochaetales bacterium]|nr:tetratricopeptide repeat protein [Spirochaetales bacterium]